MTSSVFAPQYNKPEAPGIWMNFDNTISIYHVVESTHTFDKAVQDLYGLVRDAQQRFPDWPRILYLDIDGHLDEKGRFEPDFVEYQQEFLFYVVAPFLTALETPLVGSLMNPEPQRNDIPDRLNIGPFQG